VDSIQLAQDGYKYQDLMNTTMYSRNRENMGEIPKALRTVAPEEGFCHLESVPSFLGLSFVCLQGQET
jgi:hypothetical protein